MGLSVCLPVPALPHTVLVSPLSTLGIISRCLTPSLRALLSFLLPPSASSFLPRPRLMSLADVPTNADREKPAAVLLGGRARLVRFCLCSVTVDCQGNGRYSESEGDRRRNGFTRKTQLALAAILSSPRQERLDTPPWEGSVKWETATYAKAKATSAPTTTMKSRIFQRSRK